MQLLKPSPDFTAVLFQLADYVVFKVLPEKGPYGVFAIHPVFLLIISTLRYGDSVE